MAVFLGEFHGVEDIIKQFDIVASALEGCDVLFALYEFEDDGGSAFVLFERDGTLYEVNGSHCSCYGLEHQWEPEETSVAAIRMRRYSEEVWKQLNAVLDRYEAAVLKRETGADHD